MQWLSTWHLANALWKRHVSKAPGDDKLKSKLLCSGHAESSFWFSSFPSQPCLLLQAPCPSHSSSNKSAITYPSGLPHPTLSSADKLLLLQISSAVFSEKPSLKLSSQLRVKSYVEAILFSFLTGCTKIKETSKYFNFPVLSPVPIVDKALRKDLLDEWMTLFNHYDHSIKSVPLWTHFTDSDTDFRKMKGLRVPWLNSAARYQIQECLLPFFPSCHSCGCLTIWGWLDKQLGKQQESPL